MCVCVYMYIYIYIYIYCDEIGCNSFLMYAFKTTQMLPYSIKIIRSRSLSISSLDNFSPL